MKSSKVCILGGTGFVGRHLATRLAANGIESVIPTRHPQRHSCLRTIEGVRLTKSNPFDPDQLQQLFNGCDAVINLIGILNESKGNRSFQHLHVTLGNHVVEACKKVGINRLLHMSALNASESNGPSQYLKTKGKAENRTHTLGQPQIRVTSFRPSVIFGHDDSFFNRFASLLQSIPGPFPLACPAARFAPVYVGDVVQAFALSLDDKVTWGKHYELCGPRTFSLRELVQYTADTLELNKRVIGLSDGFSRLQARALGLFPGKPFSYDNYLSLQVDSVCSNNGLGELGIEPTDIDTIVPFYLAGKSERNRYLQLRQLT
ncbi:complex I NDUFA9 subunit family protein [Candidatus Vondammii sp. HM_W22]|uniref:complex I NDUFA9 subunit family protein n=1 Tax=Candidatus Vondammii sp. HM_W22 TaxID=2687299 RepID=UPI001F141184|nr:complex I NDUFA9 subunit family protein [Candidatus Vondammii sp. HM_W22]